MKRTVAALAVAGVALAGCGEGEPADGVASATGTTERPGEAARALRVRRARCPAEVVGCRSVTGRVIYVESVDPDGDGDLHVVLAGRASVTAPGITAVDIRPDLRPRRDPRRGDRVSAAGPVQRGSFGQDQIHALELNVAP